MSRSAFGERLKRERELRGVSRDEICTATRISTRFLEALENEQWGTLPGGIFNRGFVRAVARFLGLDEDDMLAEYDSAMNGEQGPQMESSVNLSPSHNSPPTRSNRFVLLGFLCMTVLLIMGWLSWRWHYQPFRQAPYPAAHSASADPVAGLLGGTATDAPAAPANPPAAHPQGLELKIEAGKETTLSVSADGSIVFAGSMIAGQSRTFTAQNAIDVSANDAGALLLELNGQTLAPLGPPGQPGNVTLTRSDLKPTSGGAD
jgi:transcriptional regulator with XRE-family HTH domain